MSIWLCQTCGLSAFNHGVCPTCGGPTAFATIGNTYASDEPAEPPTPAPVDAVTPIRNQIICAAVKFADGRIARGHRHPDCYHCADGWTPKPDLHAGVQGFMDARNEFVDRREAKRIQDAAGIPSFDSGDYRGDILMSEDLY